MKSQRIEKMAIYIIRMVKSCGKDINYALDIVSWYAMTDREDNEVSSYIVGNWDNIK